MKAASSSTPAADGIVEERFKDGSLAIVGEYRGGVKPGEWKY